MENSPNLRGSTRKLLLVEDSVLLREVLTEEFSTVSNVEVVGWAASAEAAIAEFGRLDPDVVVLDLELSPGSGFDVLRAIRRRNTACFVIIYSGHDAECFRTLAAKEGASAFLSKAASTEMILDSLRFASANRADRDA